MKLVLFRKRLTLFVLLLPIFIIMYKTTKNIGMELMSKSNPNLKRTNMKDNNEDTEKLNMRYILLWTSPTTEPFVFLGQGQTIFKERKCPHVNCYITSNRSHLGDYTNFNVIAFHGPEVTRLSMSQLPEKRSLHQKYVFTSIESSDNYPLCINKFDGFFNWTWTYKLNSDILWSYIKVKDKNNNVLGPRTEMHWMKFEDMNPVNEELKEQLKSKTKAAAWFVSNCNSLSSRKQYARTLQRELIKFNLTVDIYGDCGPLQCTRDMEDECDEMVKEKYYFYLAFENSLSEDYVTEKLLRALQFNAVPIVYGAANYTRFMPDGIYLNARELSEVMLAKRMYTLIQSPTHYANYFKWKNHYSYHNTVRGIDADYCALCTILNNDIEMKTVTIYNNFKQWWNPPHRC